MGLSIIDNQIIEGEINLHSFIISCSLLCQSFCTFTWTISQKEIFKTKCYQEPLASFIEVGHFGCFGASIIVQDKVGEYGLEGNI
jgi:hypothetical protein